VDVEFEVEVVVEVEVKVVVVRRCRWLVVVGWYEV
jgi:hypothetical protein